MKVVLLLLFSPLCLAFCPKGQYKDDAFQKCLKCTDCHRVLRPCTETKDSVCVPFIDQKANHFEKNKIYFTDDTIDEDYTHSRNFLPHEKGHHKKNVKHSKHEDKHHHKKKHFDFDDDDYANDDFEFQMPKKHKKHYEFDNKHQKKDDDFHDFMKDLFHKKHNKEDKLKPVHSKTIVDEKELEEMLIQSQKELELQKDNLLKTLKEEKGKKKIVHLNSPVFDVNEDFDDDDDDDSDEELDDSDDRDIHTLLSSNKDDYKTFSPSRRMFLGEPSPQGKTPDETIRDEMGKNVIYEKPRFKVIPYVFDKDNAPVHKSYISKHHLSLNRKGANEWNSLTKNNIDETDLPEMKSNDVVSLPFTAAETLVWDWQAVAVASAVTSCLVFFLVVAIYFIASARQWNKFNKSYKKEIEEKSTRIALMQPILETASPDLHTTSLYMENIVGPIKEEDKKGDQKV